MLGSETKPILEATLHHAKPFRTVGDITPLVQQLSKSKIVMLGESTHGTHEFYEWRRLISQELIQKHGFSFVAIDGDWLPCQKVNQHIHEPENQSCARKPVENFHHWPSWQWANKDMHKFVQWLKKRNLSVSENERVSIHSLDCYSFSESTELILNYLEKVNPFLARRARNRFCCLDPFRHPDQAHVRNLLQFPEGSESEIIQILVQNLETRLKEAHQSEASHPFLDLDHLKKIISQADEYFRNTIYCDETSWNTRDRLKLEMLTHLLKLHGPSSRGIVWEHNTHIGDYRGTFLDEVKLINLGGLARLEYGASQVALIGFGTYEGTVTASKNWSGSVENIVLPPSMPNSLENYFHQTCQQLGQPQFQLSFSSKDSHKGSQGPFEEPVDHRAIGLVYQPQNESWANYLPTRLSKAYDVFLFFDRTEGVDPIRIKHDRGPLPEELQPIGK